MKRYVLFIISSILVLIGPKQPGTTLQNYSNIKT